ncbi:DUF4365 domain-containing protein [Pseudanabaena sp. 'Roaring Creek']|uniref:DUF4365 domain-containing protein n=1 Tax=Pseudanabaena sp. 'Roaring Creek' TaxID=1681830 RepID=UPI0009E8D1E9
MHCGFICLFSPKFYYLFYAVALAVGCSTAKPDPDDDSIDWTLSTRVTGSVLVRSPKIDIQLKCTATDCLHADHLSFPLKRKNYDESLEKVKTILN